MKELKRIRSFSVDHNKLSRGIFVSRKDNVGNDVVTTFDVRIKLPNREPILDIAILHTMEHLGATFLRNHEVWADRTIYFGPMGCQTGIYVLFQGDLESEDVVGIITEMFEFIANFQGKVPGASPVECGHYLSMDLPMTNYEGKKFLTETLQNLKEENLNYPE